MDHHTGVVSGGRLLRLWFHILLNGHKPCCWYNNSFLLFSRTLALFAGEMSHIASPLAVVSGVCLLPAGSMSACSCIASLAHPCKGSTVVLLLLAVQVCFVWESVCNLPPLLPQKQGDESLPLFCFDSRNCFCCIISCERKEESFPVVKKLGQYCYCMSCWNFSGFYFWRIKTLSPFPGFLGDSQGFNWINIMLFWCCITSSCFLPLQLVLSLWLWSAL